VRRILSGNKVSHTHTHRRVHILVLSYDRSVIFTLVLFGIIMYKFNNNNQMSNMDTVRGSEKSRK